MKKLKLILLLTGIVSSQAFSQSVNNTVPATMSRSQKMVTNAPNAFVNAVNGTTYTSNQALPKNGGIPSAAVAFSDDFSLPNDVAGLVARGYLTYYRGTGPAGTLPEWFQGNVNNWGDYNNGTNEYVSSNYNSVTGANDIDNWLVLPALNVVAGDVISFYSRSTVPTPPNLYVDSIRVMYSAAGDSIPEDLTWVELGRFQANTTGQWLLNTFIAPANGATGRFAIRYAVVDGGPQGANSDLIGIDQLDVFTPSAFDIQSLNVSGLNPQYTIIPLNQASPISLSGEVKNNGINATTGGTALFEIVDTLTSAVVFNETVNLPAINAGATAFLSTTNTFTPSAAAALRARLTVSFPGDGNATNDIATGTSTTFSDSIFARDNNLTTGSLGIGAGPADGIVGQNFEITNATSLTSISFFMRDNFDPNPAGTPIYATIHAQTAGSAPNNAVLATTDSVILLPGQILAGGEWFTLPIDGASLPLSPGLYFVGVHEVDSTLTIGTTTQIVTPQTVWVSWNTIPPPAVNGWATAEDFNFFITYNLRMNFGTPTAINEIETNSSLISLYPNPASSEINVRLDATVKNAQIEIYNSVGSLVKTLTNVNEIAKIDVSGFAKGIYSVMVNANGKSFTQRFSVAK
jgi:hypothetical protein